MSFENMDAYYAMREKIDQIKEIAQNTVLHGVPTGYRKKCEKTEGKTVDAELEMCKPPESEKYLCDLLNINGEAYFGLTQISKVNTIKEINSIFYDAFPHLSAYNKINDSAINKVLKAQEQEIEMLETNIEDKTEHLEVLEARVHKLKESIKETNERSVILKLCNAQIQQEKRNEENLKKNLLNAYNAISNLI